MRKMRDMQLNDSVTIYVVAKKITSTSDYTKLDQLGKLESHSLSREWPAMWHSCVCSEDKRVALVKNILNKSNNYVLPTT